MSIQMFQRYLDNAEISTIEIEVIAHPTRTAVDAAKAHGVGVNSIVKSLLLFAGEKPILCLVPGDKRLDLEKIAGFLNEPVRMADADEVKRITGYSIGGVPPFGHIAPIETYLIEGFPREGVVIAAAGDGAATFKTTYEELKSIVGGVEMEL